MGTLIRNGRVIDPASGKDGIYDILVEDGMIAGVDASIPKGDNDIIDAAGCFVMPGLVDLHVHFREPGFEYKETIKTGSMAAAHGGVTTVFPMPNTKPVIDSVDMYDKVQTIIDRDAVVNVHQVASVTLRQQGETPVDVAALKKAGCIAISEDGKSVMNSQVYREAMKAAAAEDMLVMAHCEDKNLVNGEPQIPCKRNNQCGRRCYCCKGYTAFQGDGMQTASVPLFNSGQCKAYKGCQRRRP